MHGGSRSGGGKKARIEIIPLIDIIFFLLATFIMVSLSMTKNQGVQVALPTAASAASLGDETDKALTLSVNDKGDVFFNKEKITIAQLPLRLQTYKTTSQDPRVIVNSDAGADFKHVVAVLDEVRKIGIGKVGINTDKR
jgi:biopolymer transport protein ExbD